MAKRSMGGTAGSNRLHHSICISCWFPCVIHSTKEREEVSLLGVGTPDRARQMHHSSQMGCIVAHHSVTLCEAIVLTSWDAEGVSMLQIDAEFHSKCFIRKKSPKLPS